MGKLAAMLGLLAANGGLAAEGPKHRENGDLAIRARQILRNYCAECHGGTKPTGRLDVTDHKALLAHTKPAPFAGKGRALIVEFVADGSMPPADHRRPTADEVELLREWVAAGAPAYPREFGDAATTAAILENWKDVEVADQEFTRYVSFGHLLSGLKPTDDPTPALRRLADTEARLRKALGPAPDGKGLVPIDGTATTFRFDLRSPGWHHTGLFLQPKDVNAAYPMTPFDLIWLENPHVVPAGKLSPAASEAIAAMNRRQPAMNPFRPQLSLRGDWLGDQLLAGEKPTPLAEELAALDRLGQAIKSGKPMAINDLRGPKPAPFARANGDAPAPISSWYVREAEGPPDAVALTVEAALKDKPVPARLQFGDQIALDTVVGDRAELHLVVVEPPDSDRGWSVAVQKLLDGNKPPAKVKTTLKTNNGGRITLSAAGTSHFIVYAATEPGCEPVVVRSKHPSDNYPIYRAFPPDPAKAVARKVIPLTVADE